jgi:signal transduction histidine kinase
MRLGPELSGRSLRPARLRALRPPRWLRLPRRTARLRLTAYYGAMFLVSGAVLLVVTNLLVRSTTGNVIFFKVAGSSLPKPPGGGGKWLGTFHSRLAVLYRSAHVPPGVQSQLNSVVKQAYNQHASDLHELWMVSAIALGAMAAASVLLGWLIAGRVLRPVRTISAMARQISASNLHERLALTGPDDEFKELGGTLDDLFGRLEAAFEAQRHFVANASHELRTPLTLERTLLQLAVADPLASVDSLKKTCLEVIESGEDQERLIDALLTLATSERGLEMSEPFDLGAITGGVVSATRGQAARLGLQLDAQTAPAPARGDPRLVERLVANLVDNACQHNVRGGRVSVMAGTRGGCAVVGVVNTGPVVAPLEIERLFQPFERLGPSRAGHSNGHGLGLSIVRAIVTAHRAALTASARPGGGLDIEVSFPAS